jgi:hypothetical protein
VTDPYEPLTYPLRIVCFGARDIEFHPDLLEALAFADLIVALGDVQLERIAELIGEEKAALCVLGDQDPRRPPPAPFTPLHGSGVIFQGWRIVGLSGGVNSNAVGPGFTLSEEEALGVLTAAPPCDILISHAPPAGLEREIGSEPALAALTEYLREYRPAYHLHANSLGESSAILDDWTLVVGVDGALVVPELNLELPEGGTVPHEGFEGFEGSY